MGFLRIANRNKNLSISYAFGLPVNYWFHKCVPCSTSSCKHYESFFTITDFTSKRKEFSEKRLIGYSMNQMFDLVVDINNYKTFVPWCVDSVVRRRNGKHLSADLVIGFSLIKESYSSDVVMRRPHFVQSVCHEGKLFNHLCSTWKFSPGLKDKPKTCIVDYSVSFEFQSVLHMQLAQVYFNEVVKKMVNAFHSEAQLRYGKESIEQQVIDK